MGHRRDGRLLLVASILSCLSLGTLRAQVLFVRGDVDDNGSVNLSDATGVLSFLFQGGARRARCLDALDVNDNGSVEISDAIRLLNHLFAAGARPEAPFPFCGPDPNEDNLTCAVFSSCPLPLEELAAGADGIYYVIDRSGSMQDSGELALAKNAMVDHLKTLGGNDEFGIVFFDRGILKFPSGDTPAFATPGTVASAQDWILSVSGGAGSCVMQGLVQALKFANASSADKNVIIYVGDGGGTCAGSNELQYLRQTLAVVAATNTEEVIIHCIGVLSIRQAQESFLTELAEQNGGRFVRRSR